MQIGVSSELFTIPEYLGSSPVCGGVRAARLSECYLFLITLFWLSTFGMSIYDDCYRTFYTSKVSQSL
jgi:hypothetical protein